MTGQQRESVLPINPLRTQLLFEVCVVPFTFSLRPLAGPTSYVFRRYHVSQTFCTNNINHTALFVMATVVVALKHGLAIRYMVSRGNL